jgi:nitroreductase|tara:strand:- start:416 stop:1012 length:597 start_codon:yes stop_codon:yes gene_type:complete
MMDITNSHSINLQAGLLGRQSIPPRLMSEPAPNVNDVHDMLAAAVCAPDHGAIRPWRFHVIQGESRLKLGNIFAEALKKREPQASLESIHKEENRPLRAPLIIAVCAKIDISRLDKIPAVEQIVSVGAACQNILLSAYDKGYGAIILTGINARDSYVKKEFGLEGPDEIVGFIYIGTNSNSITFEKNRPDYSNYMTEW